MSTIMLRKRKQVQGASALESIFSAILGRQQVHDIAARGVILEKNNTNFHHP